MRERDQQFQEATLEAVQLDKSGEGWTLLWGGGWGLYLPKPSPVEPKVGMTARFYGKGIGFPVRGVALDGVEIFYRTEEEQKAKDQADLYGADAAEWLSRWDLGRSVFSISMGGLGPGYEQCIQITAAELLRHLIDVGYDAASWSDETNWSRDQKEIETFGFAHPTIKDLQISGAQWGAALSLATALYLRGPISVMTDPKTKDRHIQVQKSFPQGSTKEGANSSSGSLLGV